MAFDPQHRPHPAVRRRGRHVHAQVELPGEPADCREPHARRITELGQQDRIRTGDHPLGPGPLVLRHAQTGVVHGDADTVVDRLEIDHDLRVGRGVPQCVVEELGHDDGDRLDGVGHQSRTGGEVVADPDAPVARETGLTAGDRVHQMGFLPGEPHPGAAHHRGDLRSPQRLLVLVVQFEQGLRQLGIVVALLQPAQGVLEPVQGRLDLPRGPAHPGLRRRVDPGALRGQLGVQPLQDMFQGETQRRTGQLRVQGAGHGDVGMRGLPCRGGQPPRRQMLDLGGERPAGAVEPGPERGRLRALCGQLPP
ncbi:hypothetical protein Q7C01_20250 [Streptomyces sp. FXY-T5]|nr:hypothetical protein [Streptomyces sp. FXY-T5]WMD06577.1 hypothetical protein Q7C01_20250 [Streptomyces sp. FXY-T5]